MGSPQAVADVSRAWAEEKDAQDPLKHLRSEFYIPSKEDILSKKLQNSSSSTDASVDTSQEPCLYLCGNSLGLQPRRTADRVSTFLRTWAKKGVHGHFVQYEDSPLAPFIPLDEQAARMMAPIVGAQADEVAIMETLTANLHLMMASFYRPSEQKFKIILEHKAFPSDHYAVESQIKHHGYNPEEAMIMIKPDSSQMMSTAHILQTIDRHADETAMILLPGIQYYTGQLLDIDTITKHAHSRDIIIGWDLAHAVGNVPLQLHSWDVDFAVWCNYKYVNAGPGSIAGLFVHARHGQVDQSAAGTDGKANGKVDFRGRLYGWWGGDKNIRFQMANHFVPIPGAQGFQVGNASAIGLSALIASLEVFHLTDMVSLRRKSVSLTQYLQSLLVHDLEKYQTAQRPYSIITPSVAEERGAQLSVQLRPGMLPTIMKNLEEHAVVLDERKPDVIRIAPVPLYNTFQDVWNFCQILSQACLDYESEDLKNGPQ